jgi:hypothetical protein
MSGGMYRERPTPEQRAHLAAMLADPASAKLTDEQIADRVGLWADVVANTRAALALTTRAGAR